MKQIPNSYTIKKKAIKFAGKQIETVILGSSQALYGINPKEFSIPTINLANASQSLYFDARLLEQQIDNLPSLKNVVFTIPYFSLYYDMNDSREKIRTYAYYHFWGIQNYNFNYFDIKNYSLIALLTPQRVFAIAKNHFKQLDEESVGTMNMYGFLAMDSTNLEARINDSLGKLKFKDHSNLIKQKNIAINITILENLLTKLSTKKIKLYFVATPTYITYNQYFNKKILSTSDSIIKQLCYKYNCVYYNWSTDTTYKKEDFYDNDHLNKYGAAKFSRILDNIITKNQ
ncbi:MAG: hypothetical protein NTZ59_13050 [Bacteroidetes bacterium]|nr:hypothetical protein [Bacteroidota bacterium]